MDNFSIKDNLRKFRKTRKLTQEDIANHLGISLTAYRDLERGNTAMVNGNILKLAELYDTSTEEIVLGYRPIQMPGKALEEIHAEYKGRVEILESRIKDLEKLVDSLEENIKTKNEIIKMLKK